MENEFLINYIDLEIKIKIARMNVCRNFNYNINLQLEANILQTEIDELRKEKRILAGEEEKSLEVSLTNVDIFNIAHEISLTGVASQDHLEWVVCDWIRKHKGIDFFEEERRQLENDHE